MKRRMKMTNIEKRSVIDSNKLKGDSYFTSILQEAYDCGLLSGSETENIQLGCIKLLAYKCERYNSGDSSSIRVETAESIMKSNLYTIGIYLKSLPDADFAAKELKGEDISELYRKGRELINARLRTAKKLYGLVRKNRLDTENYTYNSTLSDKGIGSFFKLYDPDYGAHETAASIDYRLCNTVTEVEGVEYIQKYLGRLYLENEFCRRFAAEDIHYLLSGYDKGYKDLLLNIFEQVLTGTIGCRLAGRKVIKLYVSKGEVQLLYNKLSGLEEGILTMELRKAAAEALDELGIESPALRRYVGKSLKNIIAGIGNALRTDNLEKTIVTPVNPDSKPGIIFLQGSRMADEDYRKLIDELNTSRYLQDKLGLIRERVRSFGDFEDLLLDAELEEEEAGSVLDLGGDMELAALLRHHPYALDIQAVELSEREHKLRLCLRDYFSRLGEERKYRIFELAERLIDN